MSRSDVSSTTGFACPVCGAGDHAPAFRRETRRPGLPDAGELRPTSSGFGSTLGTVVRCLRCGHRSLLERPADEQLSAIYAHVDDVETAEDEAGRAATALRDLNRVASMRGGHGGRLLDVGCWTGSLVRTAAELGWDAIGVEPSEWAVRRAVDRGLDVRQGVIGPGDGLDDQRFDVVVCCDVLEHLVEPRLAVQRIAELLAPGGVVFVTVPDSGSVLARSLGSRWWSVLPMHVQYFTRSSLRHLIRAENLCAVDMTTHPKVFPRRYYADRLGEFLPLVGPMVARAVGRARGADRPMGPDFRDRIAMIATQCDGGVENDA